MVPPTVARRVGTMAGTPFMEVSALAYTRATAALVCGTILVTYGIYLVKGGDPFLPTISNTWDTHPGTWVSRWVVGNACDMFAVVQVMLYATSTDTVGWRRVSLCLGVAGVFCLSWVGSICDSPNPDCKGNDAIHSTLAVTFFVLYDVKMILVSCRERCRTGAALGAAAAALTALRVAAPLAAGVERTHLWALAAFEWGNVALMCAWTLRQVRRTCGGLSWVVPPPWGRRSASRLRARSGRHRCRNLLARPSSGHCLSLCSRWLPHRGQ